MTQTRQIYPVRALKDNYIWVIFHSDTKESYVVDPGDSAPVITFLKQNNLKLSGILITHHHWDHVHGVEGLLMEYHAPVIGSYGSSLSTLTDRVKEGDVVAFSANLPTFQVFEIPGHTLDHIAFYHDDILFCGDTLFGAGCGRLFEGTGEMLYASLQKLAQLPDDTRVYCAHEYTLLNLQFAHHVEPKNLHVKQRLLETERLYQQHQPSVPSQLGLEKATNPFLRCDDAKLKHAVASFSGRTLTTAEDVFVALRRWKDSF